MRLTERELARILGDRKIEPKYGNRRTKDFASKREASRYATLWLRQKAGEISGLKTQVKFMLIPAQRSPETGKVIEREVTYTADFVYTEGGRDVVEDSKGFRTQQYVLRRKMMLFFHGIRVREV